jgi:hypothetical protein
MAETCDGQAIPQMIWRKLLCTAAVTLVALAQQGNRGLWDSSFRAYRASSLSSNPSVRDDAFLGVTIWRLRPSKTTDDPVGITLDAGAAWTPERVSQSSHLSMGDRFQIVVESPRSGYLYIVRQSRNSDYAMETRVIFPTPLDKDNYLSAGRVLVAPSTRDRPSYFRYTSFNPEATYTVILIPQRLPDGPGRDQIVADQLADWKTVWDYPVAHLDDPDLSTKITKAEIEAVKPPFRTLTYNDPLPQNLYHLEAPKGEPIFVDLAKAMLPDTPSHIGGFIGRSSGIIGRPPNSAPVSVSTLSRGSRITASSFLLPDQDEAPGYGLYSYVLFGARAESLDSPRWRRYFQTILAFFNLPSAAQAGKYTLPASLNLTFFPITCSRAELPKSEYQPILFQFDPKRVEAHAQEHRAGGKPFAGHGQSNIDTACTLVSSYDYSRAQRLLAMLPGSHLEGPYIISTTQPLSKTGALPAQYLYQDLSSVPPELVGLWFKEFMAQSQDAEFWKTRTKEQFVLRLRTVIGIASQQVPDFGNTITWAFITTPRK